MLPETVAPHSPSYFLILWAETAHELTIIEYIVFSFWKLFFKINENEQQQRNLTQGPFTRYF